MRYTISRSPWLRPLLILFTATESRSWVEIEETGIRAQYGWYRIFVPHESITSVHRANWPWYAGIGWRTNLRSVIGLIGSYEGVVEIAIDPPQRTRLIGIGLGMKQLIISLEDPEGFLDEIAKHLGNQRVRLIAKE